MFSHSFGKIGAGLEMQECYIYHVVYKNVITKILRNSENSSITIPLYLWWYHLQTLFISLALFYQL